LETEYVEYIIVATHFKKNLFLVGFKIMFVVHDDGENNNETTGSYTVHEPTTSPNPRPTTTIPVNNNQTNNYSLGNSLEILLRAALAIDSSNNNATDLQQYLRSAIDISNSPILTFEFPIEYEEYYDSSDNLLGRGFMGRR